MSSIFYFCSIFFYPFGVVYFIFVLISIQHVTTLCIAVVLRAWHVARDDNERGLANFVVVVESLRSLLIGVQNINEQQVNLLSTSRKLGVVLKTQLQLCSCCLVMYETLKTQSFEISR